MSRNPLHMRCGYLFAPGKLNSTSVLTMHVSCVSHGAELMMGSVCTFHTFFVSTHTRAATGGNNQFHRTLGICGAGDV